jgi:poly(3-hydroxybutyrate) depolymerase
VALRHTHGLHDHVVPMAGRSILGGRFRQGDILLGMARWRAEDACKAEPDSAAPDSGLTCTRWTSCTAGGELALCLHDGDHILSAPMLEASLRWAIHAKPATPAKP